MAFVGTKGKFERAGFRQVGVTDVAASKMPRLVMPKDSDEGEWVGSSDDCLNRR